MNRTTNGTVPSRKPRTHRTAPGLPIGRDRISNDDPLLTRHEAAAYIGIALSTLDRWAGLGIGPEFIKMPKYRKYRRSALEAYLAECTSGRAA